jgi:glycosyltransferase involved in cell wall biosynthesis
VTVYNREKYVGACLKSVLGSTFADFEVIVVDDGSTDRSLDVAKRFASDSRVKVFENERNLGDYRNRNRAASLARGRYLKFLDADDLIYRSTLETMMDAMKQFPDAGLGLSWSVIDPPFPYPFASTPREVYRNHYLGRSPLGVGPSASIIKRDAFEKMGGFKPVRFIGDSDLWLRMCEEFPLVSFQPALVWWRQHPDQQMASEMLQHDVLGLRQDMEVSYLEESKHLSTQEKAVALQALRSRYARRLIRLALRENNISAAVKLWREGDLQMQDLVRGVTMPRAN